MSNTIHLIACDWLQFHANHTGLSFLNGLLGTAAYFINYLQM